MKWLENVSLVMRCNLTALIEKVEDPERMLHQLIIDMEEELDRIRTSVARAIADEIQLGKRAKEARQEGEQWLKRATSALKRQDETSAKAALEQKGAAQERAATLEKEHVRQREQTAKLQRTVRDLENKIRQARQRCDLLAVRLAAAESSQRINRALDNTRSRSAFGQFARLEQRVEQAEAMEQAYDRLDDRDPDAEELKRQFEEKERQEQIDKEFEELKRRHDGVSWGQRLKEQVAKEFEELKGLLVND